MHDEEEQPHGGAAAPYEDAYGVWVPPMVIHIPPGELDGHAVFLLAWRRNARGGYDALITWASTTATGSGTTHAKHVAWVPSAQVKPHPPEKVRGRYAAVPRLPAPTPSPPSQGR